MYENSRIIIFHSRDDILENIKSKYYSLKIDGNLKVNFISCFIINSLVLYH